MTDAELPTDPGAGARLWDELPVVRPVPSTVQYALVESWSFYVDGKRFDLAPGFRFEASIPAAGWLLASTPFDPRIIAGAAGHDALYRGNIKRQGVDQARADRWLREAALVCELPGRKARRIHWALILFGRFSWVKRESDA